MTATPRCPACGREVELYDTLDQYPPIPYHAWPERWVVSNGEGGAATECGCGAEFDEALAADIAEAAGLERDYPEGIRVSRERHAESRAKWNAQKAVRDAAPHGTDPRGPLRTVESVTSPPQHHRVVLAECGHLAFLTRHHAPPKVGEQSRCFRCGPKGRQS